MKKFLLLIITIAIYSCNKDNSTNNQSLTPCTITNKGIYISSQPNPDGANSKENTFKIDSVVLQNNKFTLWFTENGSNEKLKATLRRYDNANFKSGTHYFIDSANKNIQPPYTSLTHPVVFFEITTLNSSQSIFFLYDKYEVCVSVENDKFGILIDGIKVADARTGNPSLFLTFSFENIPIISR